jgi:hypothetical protein
MRRLAGLLLLLAGCKVDLANGVLLCALQGKACPDDYHCAADGYCYRDGQNPDLAVQNNNSDLLSAPDLTGVKHQSDPCTPGVDVCDTGHCVDGYCCDSECTDACAACDVSDKLGQCSAVTGPSHGSRSCMGSGMCGGTCNGVATACTYPATSVICGPACNGHCDGTGGCTAMGTGSCPNGFACGANACKTSCATTADCAPDFMCQAPNCVRMPESDCLDGVDNNGDGLIDCDDPTCTTVTCVPAPGGGNELGFFGASSCPSSGFVSETLNQNLSQPTCTGCTCASTVHCLLKVNFYYGFDDTSCSDSMHVESVDVPSDDTCVQTTARGYHSYQVQSNSNAGTCTPSGSAVLPASTFATSRKFCGVSGFSANNCNHDGSKICVSKPPPSTPLCARVPGAGGCPLGYTGGTSATYYTGITPGSCGACGGCNPPSFSCQIDSLSLYTNTNCTNPRFGQTSAGSTSCSSTIMDSLGNPIPLSYGNMASLDSPHPNTASCAPPTVTTTFATPAGASVVCCPP